MPEEWLPLPIDKPLYANNDAEAIVGYSTAIENSFINELGGHTRFPGLRRFAQVDPKARRLYLSSFNEDLIAGSDKGQIYRINRAGTVENVTAVPVSGGRRIIFAETDRDLLMAAGGPIVRLRDTQTELLSPDAPNASHIGWLDNFTIAVETNSGRFYHSRAGQPDVWDALDTFAADGAPDNINSMIVTPFRELMLGGANSTEQFERQNGEVPFFRRWAIGDGVKLPYATVFADNAVFTINAFREIVRTSGQTSTSVSDAISLLLEKIDDWSDAWMGGYPDNPLAIVGQRFIIFQAPNATNAYGTKGVTIGYDYRGKKFFTLFGWDDAKGVPARWQGWSHWSLWDKTFVGGPDGWIYELTDTTYRFNETGLQRWLVRTSHLAKGSGANVKALRLRVKRGIGGSDTSSTIQVRCSRNSRPMGAPIRRSLGQAGEREQFLMFGNFGNGQTFQFEFSSTDDCPIHLIGADIKVAPLGH